MVSLFKMFLFIDFRKREEGREGKRVEKREGERDRESVYLLFHLLKHSLVASYMCPDWRSNLQPWHIRKIL